MKRESLDALFTYKEYADQTLEQEQKKRGVREEFEIKGLLKEAIPLVGTTSILKILTDEGMVELKNNRSVQYWKLKMATCEDAIIKGKHPYDKSAVSQIYYVKSRIMEELKEACSKEELDRLNEVSGKLDPNFLEQVIVSAQQTRDCSQQEETEKVLVASTYEELETTYRLLKKKYPAEVRQWLDYYVKKYPKANNDDKDRIRKKMYFLVNYYRGLSNEMLKKDPKEVRAQLGARFPGQDHVADVLCQKLATFLQDSKHIAPKILLHAPSKYGLVRMVEAFFEIAAIPYGEHSICSSTDPANLQGSSEIYNNASLGTFAEKLAMKGMGGFLIKDVDSYGTREGVMPVATMIEGEYYNELLDHPVSLQSEFMVFTAQDLDRLPFDHTGMTILEPCDYSDAEMMSHFDLICGDFCSVHGLTDDFFQFDLDAKKKIALHYVRKNSVEGMRAILEEICQNAMNDKGDKEPICITPAEVSKYFSLLGEKPHLDSDYLETIEEIRKKTIVSSERMPACLVDRVVQLLEQHEREHDDEKKKNLEKMIIELGNVRIGEESVFDLEGINREFETVRGMKDAKERLLDDLYAAEKGNNKRLKPKILVGPPGVGKTSLCDALGRGMGVPVIKLPFNQITDPREIAGYPSAYRGGKAGLLGRITQKEVNTLRCIVIIDEFDKPAYAGAYGPFYNLFDQQLAWDEWYETFFDTSGILFICTANNLGEIPYTLRDRCEIMEISSYTCKEQAEIVREILIPRLSKELGIHKKITVSDFALKCFVRDYAASGGIRELEEKLECVLKRISRQNARPCITGKVLKECLGEPFHGRERSLECDTPGVATALAVGSGGGSTFHVIAYRNPYGDDMLTTGLAEGSMAESVKYALTTASRLLDRKLEHLAIHLDSAGIKKDGPSAGITLLMAILSLETGIALGNVAFTGELSPTGRVLPVGGVREKCIAAEKAGVKTVFLPRSNYDKMKFDHELDSFEMEIVPVETAFELIRRLFSSWDFAGLEGMLKA